jgi:hypothetical protein
MKKIIALVLLTVSLSVHADRHHHEQYGSSGWVLPLIGGAIIGGVIANQYQQPPVRYYQPEPYYQPPVQYYRQQYGSPTRNYNRQCPNGQWVAEYYPCPGVYYYEDE